MPNYLRFTAWQRLCSTLRCARVSDFRYSKPWLAAAPAYEDWYLVTDFDALGNLNDAAVAGAHAAPHNDVATRAGGGTGGLYRAVLGQGRGKGGRFP